MESFSSCILGGLLLCLLAVFWILQNSFNTAREFYDSRGIVWDRPKLVRTFNRFPVEGILVMTVTVCAFVTFQVHPIWKWRIFNEEHSTPVNQTEWIHCTIFAAFFLYGLCKALATKAIQGVWYYVPLFRCFAFFIEGLLLVFLLMNGSDMDYENYEQSRLNVRMRVLHVIAIIPVVIAGMLEGWWDDPLLVRLRCFTTFLQGTWLLQMAATLYKPKSVSPDQQPEADGIGVQEIVFLPIDPIDAAINLVSQNIAPEKSIDTDHADWVMFYTMIFAWHCILSVIVITFFHALMRAISVCIYRRVLRRKLAKGEDMGMLDANNRENAA